MKKDFPVLLITGNQGKLAEFRTLFSGSGFSLEAVDADLNEIQSEDIRLVGEYKARQAVAALSGLPKTGAIICDDTALCLDAMGGLPGPLIKWFLKALKPSGIHRYVQGCSNQARAICLLSAYFPADNTYKFFEGSVSGTIVAPEGAGGFGWDSIFLKDGETATFAGLDKERKNQVSHRAEAVRKFIEYCTNNYDQLTSA